MPDRWTLRTPTGDVQLNATFHAPQYQPGGVDRGAALRRDGRSAYQRSGDGLATPGPLRLRGRVWSDERSIPAMRDELDEIRDAVAACVEVIRTNDAGQYVYTELAGGPPPAITPDGLGGWQVEIEMWPGSAEPTFLPPGFTNEWQHYRQSSTFGAWSDSITDDLLSVFATTAPNGDEPNDPQMLSWEGLRARKAGVAEFDALVRVRCASFPPADILFPGVALFVRLPAGPFTPSAGLAHMLRRHGTQLRLFYGVFDPANTPPAGSTHNFASGMVVGAWYWMRLQVTRDSTTEYVKGKMWADGDPEPDWQVQRSDAISSEHTPALGGTIGVGNSGEGGTSLTPLRVYEWDRALDLTA